MIRRKVTFIAVLVITDNNLTVSLLTLSNFNVHRTTVSIKIFVLMQRWILIVLL